METPFTPSAWDFKFGWTVGAFTSAYDVTYDFYNQDGTARYGPIEPGFKEFLKEMNKWYSEGLIDPDFSTPDYGAIAAEVLNSEIGGFIRNYSFYEYSDPQNGVEIVAAPYPKLNENDTLHIRQSNNYSKGNNSICISTVNKHIPETVAWVDYAFSDEGFLLFNYGVEGSSWSWADGTANGQELSMMPESLQKLNKHPVTDYSGYDNPNNIPENELRYISSVHATFGYLRTAYVDFNDVYNDFAEIWAKSENDWVMPNITQTSDEASGISAVYTDIETFVDENVIQFILGTRDLSEFDDYVEEVKGMGMDTILTHKQAALERYLNR